MNDFCIDNVTMSPCQGDTCTSRDPVGTGGGEGIEKTQSHRDEVEKFVLLFKASPSFYLVFNLVTSFAELLNGASCSFSQCPALIALF